MNGTNTSETEEEEEELVWYAACMGKGGCENGTVGGMERRGLIRELLCPGLMGRFVAAGAYDRIRNWAS